MKKETVKERHQRLLNEDYQELLKVRDWVVENNYFQDTKNKIDFMRFFIIRFQNIQNLPRETYEEKKTHKIVQENYRKCVRIAKNFDAVGVYYSDNQMKSKKVSDMLYYIRKVLHYYYNPIEFIEKPLTLDNVPKMWQLKHKEITSVKIEKYGYVDYVSVWTTRRKNILVLREHLKNSIYYEYYLKDFNEIN
jgi:hypothetical protein